MNKEIESAIMDLCHGYTPTSRESIHARLDKIESSLEKLAVALLTVSKSNVSEVPDAKPQVSEQVKVSEPAVVAAPDSDHEACIAQIREKIRTVNEPLSNPAIQKSLADCGCKTFAGVKESKEKTLKFWNLIKDVHDETHKG
jgi:hypothetical protein